MPCQKLRFALVWLYKLSTGWIHIRGASSSKCDGCKQRFENQLQKRASTLLAAVSIAQSNKNHFLWKETGRMVLMESNKKERDEIGVRSVYALMGSIEKPSTAATTTVPFSFFVPKAVHDPDDM